MNISRKFIPVMAIAALCSSGTGCVKVAEVVLGGLFESREEVMRNHQNPALMIEKIDSDRGDETARDRIRQEKAEEAARKKRFDEMLQKQLEKAPEHEAKPK